MRFEGGHTIDPELSKRIHMLYDLTRSSGCARCEQILLSWSFLILGHPKYWHAEYDRRYTTLLEHLVDDHPVTVERRDGLDDGIVYDAKLHPREMNDIAYETDVLKLREVLDEDVKRYREALETDECEIEIRGWA
jgi:hypothetical protein